MSEQTLEEMARHTARMEETIWGFYQNPENEKAYQEWYERKFGRRERSEERRVGKECYS